MTTFSTSPLGSPVVRPLRVLFLLCLLALTGRSLAQTAPAWQSAITPTPATSSSYSELYATAVDKTSGAVYVTGYFSGQVAFGSIVLVSAGGDDVFVARYDPGPATWAWAQRAGGSNSDGGHGIATDGTNVYVTGDFNTSASFFAGQPAATTLTGSGNKLFVVAYTATTGTGVWAKTDGVSGSTHSQALATDGTNVYVTGYFNGNATFFTGQPAATVLTTTTAAMFVAAYTAGAGTGVWAKSTSGTNTAEGNGIATDGTRVYVTGNFGTSAGFFAGQPTATTLTGTGEEVFVATYTAGAGTGVWAKSAGGSHDDYSYALATDGTRVYITGVFDTSAGFFAGQPAATTLTGTGEEVFVAAYTAGAGTGVWAKSAGGSDADNGNGIATDGTNVYVTGYFFTSATFFAGQPAATTLTAPTQKLFAAAYTAGAGTGVWAKSAGGNGNNLGYSATTDGTSLYVGGDVSLPATFDAITLSGTNSQVAVLARLQLPPTVVSFTPGSGPMGTSVTLTGTNFTGATAVAFNGTAAASFTVVNATTITATVAAGTTTGTVSVTTPGGTATSLASFVVSPAISGFTPASGPAGTAVTITGTNLDAVTGVRFGTGSLTTNFVSQSATSLTVLVPVVAATGVITLTNSVGASVSSSGTFTYTPRPAGLLARLTPAGPLDVCAPRTLTAAASSPAFNASGSGFDNGVYSVAVQADGKVLVGGSFTHYNGSPVPAGLLRLNPDGSVDAGFNAGGSGPGGTVNTIVVQADGKLLVGGTFVDYNGSAAPDYLLRLNANGSLDAGFNVGGTGFNTQVNAVVVQPDGRIVVAGDFNSYNGNVATPHGLLRLNANGSLDASFNAGGSGFGNGVNSVALQADGRIVAGGGGNVYNGTTTPYGLLRLNADGSRDVSFNSGGVGFNAVVGSVAVQPDGRILVGGSFSGYNTNAAAPDYLVRLSSTGLLDNTFNTAGADLDGEVFEVVLQADGRILVAGDFGSFGSANVPDKLIRLNANGTLDNTFNPTGAGFDNGVFRVALQADGKVVAGGFFTSYNTNAFAPDYLVRLTTGGLLDNAATPVSGASFTFSPGNTTTNPLVTSTAGSYSAVASLNGETSAASNTVVLTACPTPTLTSLNPTSGATGTSVVLTGTGFTASSTVSFNGTAATAVTFTSATSLTATVPTGATTGNVTVTTPGTGTSNGVLFTVIGDLTISTGSPTMPIAVTAGTYNNILVTGSGHGVLGGAVVVNTSLNVQPGGSLATACQSLTGTGSFTLAAGATLYVCDPAGISGSGASGAVQTGGTRSFSPDANYVYDGTSFQSTGPGLPLTVRSLTTTNANAVTLSQPLGIRQTLTVASSGDLSLDGTALTLLSDASGTALVVNSGTGLVTGGSATVQRYLSTTNLGLGYRHYSSPVSGNDLGDLATATFTPVFNSAYNASPAPGTVVPFPTVFGYDQSRLATVSSNYSAFDKGWYSPATGSTPDPFTAGQGYTVNLRGTEVVDFTGTLHSGDVTVLMARNAGATAADAGWTLVGNPYPAPINWSLVQPADRNHLDGAMYVYESSSQYGGSYRTNVNNMGTSDLIGSSQGFFVRVSQGQTSAQLLFHDAQRLTDFAQQVPVRRGPADPRPQLRLTLAGAGLTDDYYLYAEAGATAAFDGQFDATKLPNPNGLNLAALLPGGEALAIDGRADFTTATVVPLQVQVPAAGAYTLTAAALANLPAGTRLELVDNLTGQRTLLTVGIAYRFTTGAAPVPGRFWLNLTPAGAPLATANAAGTALTLYPNPARNAVAVGGLKAGAAVEVFDALGRTVAAATADAVGTARLALPEGLAAGVYVVRSGEQALRLAVE